MTTHITVTPAGHDVQVETVNGVSDVKEVVTAGSPPRTFYLSEGQTLSFSEVVADAGARK